MGESSEARACSFASADQKVELLSTHDQLWRPDRTKLSRLRFPADTAYASLITTKLQGRQRLAERTVWSVASLWILGGARDKMEHGNRTRLN